MISAISFAREVTSGIDEGVLSRMLANFREINPGVMEMVKGKRGYQMNEVDRETVKAFLDDIGQLERATNEVIKFASINKRRAGSRERPVEIQGETVSLSSKQEKHVIEQMAEELNLRSTQIETLTNDLTLARRALIIINKVTDVKVTKEDDIEKVIHVCNRLNLKPRIRVSGNGVVGITGVST